MIKQTFTLAPWLLLLGLAAFASAGDKAALTQKVMKQLDGKWEVVSVVADGTKRPGPAAGKEHVLIREGKWKVMAGDKVLGEGDFTIDPSKKPMTMNINDDKGRTELAIFEVGRDKYQVCMTVPGSGADRPTKFASEKDSGHALITYKRVK